MSYVIRYGQETKQEISLKRHNLRQGLVWSCLGTAALVGFLWSPARDMVRQLLCPWLDEMTIQAFGKMINSIGDGTAVPAALVEFCREIIGNAGILV